MSWTALQGKQLSPEWVSQMVHSLTLALKSKSNHFMWSTWEGGRERDLEQNE